MANRLIEIVLWHVRQSLSFYPGLTKIFRFICLSFSCLFLFLACYVSLMKYLSSNSMTIYASVSSISASINLFFAIGLTILTDLTYEFRLFPCRFYERILTISLIFCFQTYAASAANVISELIVDDGNGTKTINLSIFCALSIVHIWHFLLKQIVQIDREHQLSTIARNQGRLFGA